MPTSEQQPSTEQQKPKEAGERSITERLNDAKNSLADAHMDIDNLKAGILNIKDIDAEYKRTGVMPDGYHQFKRDAEAMQEEIDAIAEDAKALEQEIKTIERAEALEQTVVATEQKIDSLRPSIQLGRPLDIGPDLNNLQGILDELAGHPDLDPDNALNERIAEAMASLYDLDDRTNQNRPPMQRAA